MITSFPRSRLYLSILFIHLCLTVTLFRKSLIIIYLVYSVRLQLPENKYQKTQVCTVGSLTATERSTVSIP